MQLLSIPGPEIGYFLRFHVYMYSKKVIHLKQVIYKRLNFTVALSQTLATFYAFMYLYRKKEIQPMDIHTSLRPDFGYLEI